LRNAEFRDSKLINPGSISPEFMIPELVKFFPRPVWQPPEKKEERKKYETPQEYETPGFSSIFLIASFLFFYVKRSLF